MDKLQPGDICEECLTQGLNHKLRYFYLNLEEQLLKCESRSCLWPHNDEVSSDEEDDYACEQSAPLEQPLTAEDDNFILELLQQLSPAPETSEVMPSYEARCSSNETNIDDILSLPNLCDFDALEAQPSEANLQLLNLNSPNKTNSSIAHIINMPNLCNDAILSQDLQATSEQEGIPQHLGAAAAESTIAFSLPDLLTDFPSSSQIENSSPEHETVESTNTFLAETVQNTLLSPETSAKTKSIGFQLKKASTQSRQQQRLFNSKPAATLHSSSKALKNSTAHESLKSSPATNTNSIEAAAAQKTNPHLNDKPKGFQLKKASTISLQQQKSPSSQRIKPASPQQTKPSPPSAQPAKNPQTSFLEALKRQPQTTRATRGLKSHRGKCISTSNLPDGVAAVAQLRTQQVRQILERIDSKQKVCKIVTESKPEPEQQKEAKQT